MGNNLTQRVQNNQIARKDPEAASLRTSIQNMEHQFALAMPKGVEAAQLVRDALTSIQRNPKLAECDRFTVLGGLMTCAQLGLRPGVLGHAWLLPFWNAKNRRFEAQLVIGYQGYAELANRSGQIKSMIARTVYSNDHFSIEYGLDDKLVHRPAMTEDRGIPIGYYAIVVGQPLNDAQGEPSVALAEDLVGSLAAEGFTVHSVGDARGVGYIEGAIRSAGESVRAVAAGG